MAFTGKERKVEMEGEVYFEVAKNTPKPSFAFPFSPAEVEKGRIYEFQLNHVIELDDPFELIRMEYVTIDGKEE